MAASRHLRVLVVEDERDTADSLSFLLGLWGHESLIASDGAAALDAVPSFRPDLVLLDLGLPQLSGYDVVRQLRQRPEGAGLPVWVMSGFAQESDRQRAREAGADLFLVKPADPAHLAARLEEAVRRRKMPQDAGS
jgi:DNA-binding response OmpR family regulator